MKQCKYRYVSFGTAAQCGSWAFNLHKDVPPIDQGDFCDKCYWRNIVESNINLKPVWWLGVTVKRIALYEDRLRVIENKIKLLEDRETDSIRESVGLPKTKKKKARRKKTKVTATINELWVVEKKKKASKK